jgi:hypothetical protein
MSDPSEPLGLTVHSLPQPGEALTHALTRQRASGRIKMLMVLLVCAAPVVASYYTYYIARPSGGTAYSTLIQPAVAMPAVVGRTLAGQDQPLRDLVGQWQLVVVSGGACDAACEKRLFLQRQLREMTGREADRVDKLWILLDDAPVPAALRAAIEATPAMTVLRLPRAVVEGWLKPATGQALEDHLYIVDPLGDWMMRAPAQADPTKLKRDVERLLRASAGWDKAGRQALIAAPVTSVAPVPSAASPKP